MVHVDLAGHDQVMQAMVGGFWSDVGAKACQILSPGRDAGGWFPGRWIGGIALLIAPVLWLTGMILRYAGLRGAGFDQRYLTWLAQQPFAAAGQLAAYEQNRSVVVAGYAVLAAACIVGVLAFCTLAKIVAERSPVLAQLGGAAVIMSLTARLYFAGIDLTAFHLVDALGLEAATAFVMDSYVELSYGLAYVPVAASAGALVGGVLLAVAALRSGTLGVVRAVLLLGWAWTFLGVLKDSDVGTVIGAVGLCLVLIPIGVALLTRRDGSDPREPADHLRRRWVW